MKKILIVAVLSSLMGCSSLNNVSLVQAPAVFTTYVNDINDRLPALKERIDFVEKTLLDTKVLTEDEVFLLKETSTEIKTVLASLLRTARSAPVSRDPAVVPQASVSASQLTMYVQVVSNAANVVKSIVENHKTAFTPETIDRLAQVNTEVIALVDTHNALDSSGNKNVTSVVSNILQIVMTILEIAKVVAVIAA